MLIRVMRCYNHQNNKAQTSQQILPCILEILGEYKIKTLNLELGIAENSMKQDGIVIMLHQINSQIPNLTQISEHVCLRGNFQ